MTMYKEDWNLLIERTAQQVKEAEKAIEVHKAVIETALMKKERASSAPKPKEEKT